MLFLAISILFTVAYGLPFIEQELASTGLKFDVDVKNDGKTVVKITGPTADVTTKWSAIGFGSLTMASTYVLGYDGTNPSDWELPAAGTRSWGTNLNSNAWTKDSAVDNGDGTTTITLSRNNDVSGSCAKCYTFDPAATTLQVITGQGPNTAVGTSAHSSKAGYTLQSTTYEPTTAMPTSNPVTKTPTPSNTPEPTTMMPTASMSTTSSPEYTECGTSTLVSGVTLTVSRKASEKKMEITISGPTDKWFAYGFGAMVMKDTYAVIASGSAFDVSERKLGSHAPGTTVGPTGTVEKSTGTTRKFILTRPYAIDGTYDFTKFMDCTVTSIDIIAAHGTGIDFANHGGNNRKAGTLTRTCACDATTKGPDDSAANNIFNAFYISLVVCFALYFMA